MNLVKIPIVFVSIILVSILFLTPVIEVDHGDITAIYIHYDRVHSEWRIGNFGNSTSNLVETYTVRYKDGHLKQVTEDYLLQHVPIKYISLKAMKFGGDTIIK